MSLFLTSFLVVFLPVISFRDSLQKSLNWVASGCVDDASDAKNTKIKLYNYLMTKKQCNARRRHQRRFFFWMIRANASVDVLLIITCNFFRIDIPLSCLFNFSYFCVLGFIIGYCQWIKVCFHTSNVLITNGHCWKNSLKYCWCLSHWLWLKGGGGEWCSALPEHKSVHVHLR